MIDGLAWALEGSSLAIILRGSFWLYPLVNAGHIVGIAILFGAIVPMDLRMLGMWRSIPAATLARVLVPTAIAGFLIVLATGPLLFIVQAQDYVASPWFQAKLALIAAALVNALLLRASDSWRALDRVAAVTTPRLAVAGILSLLFWLGAVICGRLIAYA